MLVLVLVIAQKLSQARGDLADPIRNGDAVVLIDELDMHLHPKWQRGIVDQLTRTFPKCQFIATTHSPQVIASVDPESILLITPDRVERPDRSLGMDTNWILRHVMEDDDRPADASNAIREVEQLIKEGKFAKARKKIAEQRKNGPDLPDWGILETRMARLEFLAK